MRIPFTRELPSFYTQRKRSKNYYFQVYLPMKKTKLCLFIGMLLSSFLCAQSTDETITTDAEWLEIGGIEVVGLQQANAKTVSVVAGLKVGDRIQVPGPSIQRAIRNLWQQKLFTDIQILEKDRKGDIIFLAIHLEEVPRLAAYTLGGIKKTWEESLRKRLAPYLVTSTMVTPNVKITARRVIKEWLLAKGYYFGTAHIIERRDPTNKHIILDIQLEPGTKTKVQGITFQGHEAFTPQQLKKTLVTKSKRSLFGKKHFLPEQFKADQQNILQFYQSHGYLDAAITAVVVDTLSSKTLGLHLQLSEGKPYYFRNITWKGNAVYSSQLLAKILGIKKGDIYNPMLLEQRLKFDPKNGDISALYQDHGYLFFDVRPVITYMENQEIDIELRIAEGPLAKIGRISITGNEQTHEHVIRRELSTQPGEAFSRADILRSQQALINLGYFNPETLDLKTTVNPEEGTVDLDYQLEEETSSKYELSASWNPGSSDQGGGIVGTVGVTLNNFSLRKLFQSDKGTFTPMGDGQTLSIRAQSTGGDYQGLNFSFTEPWLGGKRPNSLSLSAFYQRFTNNSSVTAETPFASMSVIGGSINLGARLKGLNGNLIASTELSYQNIDLNGLDDILLEDGSTISEGNFNNLYLKQSLTYYTLSDPFFPTKGAKIKLSGQITPPYSLFGNETSRSFKWMEYHKWRFDAEWYTLLNKKWVLKLSGKTGWLSAYDSTIGLPPFERFELGGNGTNTQQLAFAGNDLIALRGYPADYLEGTLNGGGASFAKFSAELRYPIVNSPAARGFLLAFGEAGNIWKSSSQFNPFDVKPAVGLGIRLQVPFLGMIGLDYGLGLDRPDLSGQKWSNYGTFNFIIGFEPE